jgi:hypothetical protein
MEFRAENEIGCEVGVCMVGEMMNGGGWGLVVVSDTFEIGKGTFYRLYAYNMQTGQEWTISTVCDVPQYKLCMAGFSQELKKRFNNTRSALILPNDPKAEHGILTPFRKAGRATQFTHDFLRKCGITGDLVGPDGTINVSQ